MQHKDHSEPANNASENSSTPASFSLFELMQHLRRIVAFNMRQTLWIRAEISSASQSKGTYYLELVQRDDMQIKARCQAVIWQSVVAKLKEKFQNIDFAQIFVGGQQVLLQVEATLHEYHGLKLEVKDVDLVYTVGELEQKRLQTWQQIEKEALHQINPTLKLPKITQRIAVISSKTAAGYRDFEVQLHQNPHGYFFETTLFENAMQGENVRANLIQNLKEIAAYVYAFDAIVIVRGGGSKLDLVWFDDYEICKAIAHAPLPVITGIGHEIDESLADKVAFQSLKTPTAVAEFLINKLWQAQQEIQALQKRFELAQQNLVSKRNKAIDELRILAAKAIEKAWQEKKNNLAALRQRYEFANPRNTLNRGFVLVFDENKNRITNSTALEEGQTIVLHFADGSRKVVVIAKN